MQRAWLALLALAGCDREVSYGDLQADSTDDGGSPPTSFSCTQRGPLVPHGDGNQAVCGAASRGFHHALCSCGNITSEQEVVVDGFDSARTPYAAGEASGALGSNGALYPARLVVGGSLFVAGSGGAPLNGDLSVGGRLEVAGQLGNPHVVRVAGDARIAGDVRPARIDVGGRFTLAPGAAFEPRERGSTPERGAVSVAPPCRCDDPRAPDVAALVRAAARANDDAREALDPARGLHLDDGGTRALPCGSYYVDDVFSAGHLTLRIEGRVALHVGTRIVIDPGGRLDITLVGDAELDLFVAGGIAANGPMNLGDPRHPDRLRVYVGGGTGDGVYFGGSSAIAAAVYAPRSELVVSDGFSLYGAALTASAVFSQPARLHYDRALAGDTCDEARCDADADCAPGLRCDGSRCLP